MCALLVALFIYTNHRRTQEMTFFSGQLRTHNVMETVAIGKQNYTIQNGTVRGDIPLSRADTAAALRLAYEKTLARRNPLLDISGSDPAALMAETDRLQRTVEELAAAQPTPHEASLVRSLYPIRFLRSLSSLERARRAFLSSGSLSDEAVYRRELETTIANGIKDATAFEAALHEIIGTRAIRFPTLGGTLTSAAMERSAADIVQGMNTLERAYADRVRCTHGDSGSCDSRDISMPVPDAVAETIRDTGVAGQEMRSEILSLLKDASNSSGVDSKTVVLSSSVCFGALPPPYYFSIQTPVQTGGLIRIRFLNDLLFSTTDKGNETGGSILSYLRRVYGISYSPANFLAFYLCPDNTYDLSRVISIAAVADFARAHRAIAPTARAPLLSSPVREPDAIAYLQKALEEVGHAGNAGDINALMSLSLPFKNHGAGLDAVVANIARINAVNVFHNKDDVPFDLSASTLFLTHSAFPALFLSNNPSAGSSGIPLREEDPSLTEAYLSGYIRYADLRAIVPRDAIIKDMRAFYDFESELGTLR